MSRRDIGFLLVGLGVGLLCSFVAAVEMTWWMRHMFIMEIHWPAYFWMAVPWLFLIAGSVVLYRERKRT